jgi:hypothetical protein
MVIALIKTPRGTPAAVSVTRKMSVPGGASFTADGGSFSAAFDELHRGYPAHGSAGLYIDEYKKIARNWKNYTNAIAEVADDEESRVNETYNLIKDISKSSIETESYRQALQARNQANLLAVQQIVNVRLDIAREKDLLARDAMDQEQVLAERHAAFGRAVGGGRHRLQAPDTENFGLYHGGGSAVRVLRPVSGFCR